MPLLTSHSEASFCWGIWKMEEDENALLELLPRRQEHLRELRPFALPRRRLERLAVRALLYTLTGTDTPICYEASGRPYLSDVRASFSASHTDGYAAVLVGQPDMQAGIDIERYSERVRKVASRFIRKDEQPQLFHNTDLWALLLHWSAKETLFKCLNQTDIDFSRHLRIFPFEPQPEGSFLACEYRTPRQQQFRLHYFLHPDFVLTACCQPLPSPPDNLPTQPRTALQPER